MNKLLILIVMSHDGVVFLFPASRKRMQEEEDALTT